jgi:sterol 24-C-methyltransferase
MSAQAKLLPKLNFWLYRLATVAKSLKTLYTLPKEKVDAFMNSYDIYDHDWRNERQFIQDMGQDYYNQVKKKLVDYYSVLNHLCAVGQVEKMYIPPALDLSKSIMENQELFEEKMAKDLGLKSGDTALDIGCGRGRIASHMARVTQAKVTGMNLDQNQLESAKRFALGHGLSHLTQFRYGDLNELPLAFEDNSFNAVYHVQVFSYAKDMEKLFKDIYRIVKPGGKVACLDWVSLPAFDPKNAHHLSLMRRVKPLIGAIGTPTVDQYVGAIKKAGFEVLISENPSIDGLQAPLIENADKFFKGAALAIKILVACRLLPKHFKILFDRLTKDGEAFVEADRLRIVTTTHYIVAKKH